jgi:hypothetical protein
MSMFGLAGKRAPVTGASRGIGRAITPDSMVCFCQAAGRIPA